MLMTITKCTCLLTIFTKYVHRVSHPLYQLTWTTAAEKFDNNPLLDVFVCVCVQLLFAGIEVAFRTRLREHLLRLGIRNDGSSRHGSVQHVSIRSISS